MKTNPVITQIELLIGQCMSQDGIAQGGIRLNELLEGIPVEERATVASKYEATVFGEQKVSVESVL